MKSKIICMLIFILSTTLYSQKNDASTNKLILKPVEFTSLQHLHPKLYIKTIAVKEFETNLKFTDETTQKEITQTVRVRMFLIKDTSCDIISQLTRSGSQFMQSENACMGMQDDSINVLTFRTYFYKKNVMISNCKIATCIWHTNITQHQKDAGAMFLSSEEHMRYLEPAHTCEDCKACKVDDETKEYLQSKKLEWLIPQHECKNCFVCNNKDSDF